MSVKALLLAVVAGVSAIPAPGHGGMPAQQFPDAWGTPPMHGTKDLRPLPGGYGFGSSTLANWITQQMETEKAKTGMISYPPAFGQPPMMQTMDLRPLPFGYGSGSSTVASWLSTNAESIYGETAEQYTNFFNAGRRLVGGNTVAGGASDIDIGSEEVQGAAMAAYIEISKQMNSLTPPTLAKIESASKQVVAGVKYDLVIALSNGSRHHIVIVDTPWLTPRWSLMTHEVLP